MNNILSCAMRTFVRRLVPIVRTKFTTIAQSKLMLIQPRPFSFIPLISSHLEQYRCFTLTSALCKRRKKGEKHDKPVCGRCPRKLPIKFPLCTKRSSDCMNLTGKKRKKGKKGKKGCKTSYPLCKGKDNCPYVNPRVARDRHSESGVIDEAVKEQLKIERAILRKAGKGGHCRHKKRKGHKGRKHKH